MRSLKLFSKKKTKKPIQQRLEIIISSSTGKHKVHPSGAARFVVKLYRPTMLYPQPSTRCNLPSNSNNLNLFFLAVKF